MSKKLEPVKKTNHFVDKVKFYEHLKERYKTVIKVKEKVKAQVKPAGQKTASD